MSVKSVNRPATLRKLLSATAMVLAIGAFDQSCAYAGNGLGGFAGGFVGGFVGGMMGGMAPRYYLYNHRGSGPAPSNRSHAGSHGSGASSVDPPSPAEASRALASLAPPTTGEQQAILKSVTPSQSLGAVGASDDLEQIGKDDAEASRDYTGKIDALITLIQQAQTARHSTKEGDVTEHGILEALDSSIREANLTRFETFLGENWSPERLRVMILERVENEIGSLFDGTNRGAVTMNDLDLIIAKSARSVYARLFETSELLAANRSSTLFVQRLYQTHGDLVNGEVRESTEQLLADASSSGLSQLEPKLRRDPNAFALRYRAQRIIYDCLSDNVETITSSESGMATSAEIRQRVLDVTQQQCANWVSAQLLEGNNKVKPQDPMPLRVIWTAEGAKDDASMYGRATDQL
jgi:hypothetical protein